MVPNASLHRMALGEGVCVTQQIGRIAVGTAIERDLRDLMEVDGAVAVWLRVQRMLRLLQVTSAPNSVSVSTVLAIWFVMCKQPASDAFTGQVRPWPSVAKKRKRDGSISMGSEEPGGGVTPWGKRAAKRAVSSSTDAVPWAT